MKIVQSYWTKPYNNIKNECTDSWRGWYDKVFHYMSCALSCLKAAEFYPVGLITDKNGKRILIDEIGLPYNSVSDDLECIDYPAELWAVGKLITYAKQDSPFIHIDNDVFIWDKFSHEIENGRLIAQSKEENHVYYEKHYSNLVARFSYIPEQILICKKKQPLINAVNAGILGGNDVSFFKEYTKEALIFIERNINKLQELVEPETFNLIFEQYLFYCIAQNKKEDIEYIFNPKSNLRNKDLVKFYDIPINCTYIHPFGNNKNYYVIGEQIAQRLWFEYPEYYNRIHELIKKGVL